MKLIMKLYHHIGGLDVTIHSIDDLLYEKINKYKYDEYFFNRALALFLIDYKKYFKNNIKECLRTLFLIEHRKEFYELIDLKEICEYGERKNIDIHQLDNERNIKEKELEELKQEYDELKNKRYNIRAIFAGKKKKNQERINELHNMNTNTGLIRSLCSEIKRINDKTMEFYNEIEEYASIEAKIDMLKAKLRTSVKAAFPNDLEFERKYIDGGYCTKEDLEKLVDQKRKYNKKLIEYRNNWKIAESYYDNFSKIKY